MIKLILGNCLEKIKDIPDNSIDSIVTDPPYGLSFMGKKWDYDVPKVEIWKECFRVLKPGGHLLSFAGTRTQHRMAVNIEDAGFEIRDMIAWVYGSGFPKSLNIGKAVDKLQGNEREVVGKSRNGSNSLMGGLSNTTTTTEQDITKGNSPYEGWGTALKPALEPITVARKPISEKNIAENVLKWGTGGINIDESRVEYIDEKDMESAKWGGAGKPPSEASWKMQSKIVYDTRTPLGRFPANFIHDGSEEVVELFPNTKSGGGNKNSVNNKENSFLGTGHGGVGTKTNWEPNAGSASRFFYCAKASKGERNSGLEKNNHPTVKPIKLMEYLVTLVTPKNGTVLDPFMGSGSTGIACRNKCFSFVGIELDKEYLKIAEKRINKPPAQVD